MTATPATPWASPTDPAAGRIRAGTNRLSIAALLVGAVAIPALLSGCGGGGGETSARCPAAPCVVSGFVGDPDWRMMSGGSHEGGVGDGADGGGGVGGGAGLGIVRAADVVVTFNDGTTRSALTDTDKGMVTIIPVPNYAGSVLVEVRGRAGATYYDEGRDTTLPFPEGRILRAVIPKITRNIGVTAFTEAAYRLALQCQSNSGPVEVCAQGQALPEDSPGSASLPPAKAIRAANAHLTAILNQQLPAALQVDDIAGLPFLIGQGTAVGDIASTPRGRYGLANAAFSKQAAMYNGTADAPTLLAVDQLAQDLEDGRLDGRGGTAIPAALRTYDPHSLTSELSSALAQQTTRYADTATRVLLPPVTAFANTRYDSYYFDATLEPDGTSSTIAMATESSVDRRAPGERTAYAGPGRADARGFMLYGNMGSGALFIKTDTPDSRGRLLAIGDNTNGELGNGAGGTGSVAGPSVPAMPGTVTHVAGGIAHTVARFADGSVFAWGDNSAGQLGQAPSALAQSFHPVPVGLPAPALAVAATNQAAFALLENGSVWSWGSSFGFGTLGDNAVDGLRPAPGPVMSTDGALAGIVQLSARDNDVIALGADGSVWTWGSFPSAGTAASPSGIAAGRTVATRIGGIPRSSGGVRKVLTEQGLFAVLVAGSDDSGNDVDGAVYAWGVHFDITANTVLRDLEPRRVLNLPPIRDLMPGGFLGYGQRPADRLTAMAIDYDGGLWKIRGRVAEHYDPANPTAQRRPQGQAPREDCAACHVIRPRTVPPVPTTGPPCAVPSHILALLTAQSTCGNCHNSAPLSSGRVLGALTCVPPVLAAPPAPTRPTIRANRCELTAGHPRILTNAACSSCHNSIVAAPLECSADLTPVAPPSTTTVVIASAVDDLPPGTGEVGNGGTTNDTTPTLTGSVSAPLTEDEYLNVLQDGTPIGKGTVTGQTWRFEVPALATGNTYSFTARVDRAGAGAGVASPPLVLVITTQGSTKAATIQTVNGVSRNPVTITTASPTLAGAIQANGAPSSLAAGEGIELERTGPGQQVTLLTSNFDVTNAQWRYSDSGLADGLYTYKARVTGPSGPGPLGTAVTVIVDTSRPQTGPAIVVSADFPAGIGNGVRANSLGLSDPSPTLSVTLPAASPAGSKIEFWLTAADQPARLLGSLATAGAGQPVRLAGPQTEISEGKSHTSANTTPPDGGNVRLVFRARLVNAAGTEGEFGPESVHYLGLFSCQDLFVARGLANMGNHAGKTGATISCGAGCHQLSGNGMLQGLPGGNQPFPTQYWCTHAPNNPVRFN